MILGYYDENLIQRYEKAGIKWGYRVEPLSGEMLVVPEGTEDYELYELPILRWLSFEGRGGLLWYWWQGDSHCGFQVSVNLGSVF